VILAHQNDGAFGFVYLLPDPVAQATSGDRMLSNSTVTSAPAKRFQCCPG